MGSRQGGAANTVPALYSLGLNWETLSLVQYNPLWPVLYEAESKRITGNFSNGIEKLEHVGSTAVPGLGSKPIIDIICAVDSLKDICSYIINLAELGYRCFGECGRPGRYFFTLDRGEKTFFHLHLVTGRSCYWSDLVSFRDLLRSDKALADYYFRHKLDLQKRYGHDRRNYREGKEQWFEENFPRNWRDGGL